LKFEELNSQLVADDLQFPEGPLYLRDGSILLVEIRRQTLTRIFPDGQKKIVAQLGGGPNGLAMGPDAAIYVTNNGGSSWIKREDGLVVSAGPSKDYTTGSIQRVELESGNISTVFTHCGEVPLRGPNDLVFDRTGGLWFTDSGKKSADGQLELGKIYYARLDTKEIHCAHKGMLVPNGIGLSPDENTLFVSETMTSRVYACPIISPGLLAPVDDLWSKDNKVRCLGPLPGLQMLDSLAVEAGGNICVGTLIQGGISIFSPDTDTVEKIPFPDQIITNICFGGDDMCDAWITAAGCGALYKAKWPRPGLKLNFTL
jgi:gluconolactonase